MDVGIIVVIVVALIVFWLVAHISVLLGVIAALLVLAVGLGGGQFRSRRL